MPLSCACDEWDGEGIGYWSPDDFTTLQTKKRKRCKSCKKLIEIGAEVLKFERFHYSQSKVEERIYGDGEEIFDAPWYHCAHCGEIFLNLFDLNFCIEVDENMDELMDEYRSEIAKDNGLYQGKGSHA